MRRRVKDDLWEYRKQLLKTGRKYIFVNIILMVLLAVILIVPRCGLLSRKQVEFYSSVIFPKVSFIGNTISSFFVFNITEALVIALCIFVPVILISLIVSIVKAESGIGLRRFILRKFLTVLLTVSVILSTDFTLMHGLNYYRRTAASQLDISGEYLEYQDFLDTMTWAYNGMLKARSLLGEDYNGVSHMLTDFETAEMDANELLLVFNQMYDMGLSDNYVSSKPVTLSHWWSYTNIVGMYNPFIGETIINTDYMDILDFPLTLVHELTHAKGYARENDANAIAALALIHSDRADFRYCGYYEIFRNVYFETCMYADKLEIDRPNVASTAYEGVLRDLVASAAYWNQINAEITSNPIYRMVQNFSEQANDAYLKANGQTNGTDSYNVSPSIYVDFYCKYVRE